MIVLVRVLLHVLVVIIVPVLFALTKIRICFNMGIGTSTCTHIRASINTRIRNSSVNTANMMHYGALGFVEHALSA